MKKQQQISGIILALATVLPIPVLVIPALIPALAKSLPNKPLKVIAPDLIIETAELGEFLDDPADPRHFKQSDVVGKKCGLFGWRMKVRTTRNSVLVQDKATQKGDPSGLPVRRVPKYGYLFSAGDIVQSVSPGQYSSTVFVENIPIKTFVMTVE